MKPISLEEYTGSKRMRAASLGAQVSYTWKVRPMRRKQITGKDHPIIAYDLETTPIKKGTPDLRYITGFGKDFNVSQAINSEPDLLRVLLDKFLTPENDGARFVAWNGNRYDVYFIARAALLDSSLIIRPYLTGKNSLRGLKLIRSDKKKGKYKNGNNIKGMSWEFLDGIAMTGIERSLKDFLTIFAPGYEKLSLDWSKTVFDANDPAHVAYAERDSEGLYHGMIRADTIMRERFATGLNPTIGNTGIKIFQSQMPEEVACWRPGEAVEESVRKYAMRGGYCYCVKRYEGPVYKYDLNQAYAAAMRDAKLPCGTVRQTLAFDSTLPGMYEISAPLFGNTVPLYIKDAKGRGLSSLGNLNSIWLMSIEIEQLISEGYPIEIKSGYVWQDFFSMTEYVDNLERMRMIAPGGPSGAEGLMIKAIGNNSYGKTVEQLTGEEIVMSLVQPEGFKAYALEDTALNNVWCKNGKSLMREYHCPQIGAFITAYVRMVVRRAVLLDPVAWLYADTDCVMFSRPIALSCHPSKYGEWKIEVSGDLYRIIGKKVYCQIGGKVKHAKGMNVARLGDAAFKRWFNGHAPVQHQLHRKNFLRFFGDSGNMFETRKRHGELIVNQRKGVKNVSQIEI